MQDIYLHHILDLTNNTFVQFNTIQGDGDRVRGIIFELIANNAPYIVNADTVTVSIGGTKPDGTTILNDCEITEEGYVSVDITSQMTTVAGRGEYQLFIIDQNTDSQLKSYPFYIFVNEASVDIENITSSDEFKTLTNALSSIASAEEVANRAEAACSEAETILQRIDGLDTKYIASENERENNETNRQNAESSRAKEFEELKTEIDAELTKLGNTNVEAVVSNDSYKVKVTNKDGVSTVSDNLLNSLTIGSVETGDFNEDPTASITGKFGEQKLNLRLPSGKPFKISKVYSSIANMEADMNNIENYDFIMIHTGSVEDEDTGKLYMKDTNGMVFLTDLSGVQGIQGVKGETGATPNLVIGTVSTSQPGTDATVTITGTKERPVINFVIPRGEPGKVDNLYSGNIPYANIDDENSVKDVIETIKEGLNVTNTTSSTLTNSHEGGIKLIGVHGKSEQESTKGYQLFDANWFKTKSQGGATVTNNGDGSLTISGSGTLTEAFYAKVTYTHEETVALLKAGELILNAEQKTLPRLQFTILDSTKQYNVIANGTDFYLTSLIKQETLDNENIFMVAEIYGGAGTTIIPGTIKPMLYQDGDGTWEPFTGGKASPNPDYPQSTKPVVVSEIKSVGANLFPSLTEKTVNGVTIKKDVNGVYHLSGTATDNVVERVILGLPKDEYSLTLNTSKIIGTSGADSIYIACREESGSWVTSVMSYSTNGAYVVDKIYDAIFVIPKGVNCDGVTIAPMLNKGKGILPYAPHTESVVKLSKPITLNGIGESADELLSGTKRFATVEFTGNEGWTTYSTTAGVYYLHIADAKIDFQTSLCTHFRNVNYAYKPDGKVQTYCDYNYSNARYFNTGFETVEQWKAYLAEQYANGTPVTLTYELAEPIIEALPEADQIALHGLKSFNGVTHISTDSEVKPTIEMLYGTSKVGALALENGELHAVNEIVISGKADKSDNQTQLLVAVDLLEKARTVTQPTEFYYNSQCTNRPSVNGGFATVKSYYNASFFVIYATDIITGVQYENSYYNHAWLGWKESAYKSDLNNIHTLGYRASIDIGQTEAANEQDLMFKAFKKAFASGLTNLKESSFYILWQNHNHYWMKCTPFASLAYVGIELFCIGSGRMFLGTYRLSDDSLVYYRPVIDQTDLESYLPKKGGTVDEILYIGSTGATTGETLAIQNSKRAVLHQVTADGRYVLYDNTNGESIITSALDGTNTFNGTASGNLTAADFTVEGDTLILNFL